MFTLSVHNWCDAAVEIQKRAKNKGITLITPIIGKITDIKHFPAPKNGGGIS